MNYPAFPTIPHQLLINTSAISRVLRCIPSQITGWEERGNGLIIVTLKGDAAERLGVTASVTKAQLETEFHRYRMEAGSELEAYRTGQGYYGDPCGNAEGARWDVRGSQGDIYQIEIVGDHYRCTCEDWHQHQTLCKHGWAVHFTIEATKKLSCHDCGHWTTNNGGYCKLRAQADLEQLPITHAEVCHFLIVGFEEF